MVKCYNGTVCFAIRHNFLAGCNSDPININSSSKYFQSRWNQCVLRIWLTHWGRVTHICVDNLTIIASDNGLSPGRRQAIFWNNAGILLIGPLGTNFSEILIESLTFSLKKMRLKMSSATWRPRRLGLNVLKQKALNHTRITVGCLDIRYRWYGV